MRIQYTLPGMKFGRLVDQPGGPAAPGSSFKSRLRRLTRPETADWRSVLRLDRVRPHAAIIGPPPKPASLDVKDMAGERHRWRNLLARPAVSNPSIQQMMALLRSYQAMEDAIVARHLTDTRG